MWHNDKSLRRKPGCHKTLSQRMGGTDKPVHTRKQLLKYLLPM